MKICIVNPGRCGGTLALCYLHSKLPGYEMKYEVITNDLPQSENEINRNLEQLRAVDNNFKIKVIKVKNNPPSVDTLDDLEKIRLIFKKNNL